MGKEPGRQGHHLLLYAAGGIIMAQKRQIGADYYVSRKSKLLKDFDKIAKRVRNVFVSYYGTELTEVIMGEVRLEYEKLIPQLPYIRVRQPLISTAQFLAMYRVIRAHGKTVEEIGKLIYEASRKILDMYPGFVLRILGLMSFSGRHLKDWHRGAAESQKREFPEDFVFTVIEGSEGFDYGVDYTECACCKFLNKQGALELAPYICATDIIYSEKLGTGLVRTMTLADGYNKCDFRFKKGGATRVKLSESVRLSIGAS